MPYHVVKRGGKFVVEKADGTKTFGTHDTKADADKQLAALNISEHRQASVRTLHLLGATGTARSEMWNGREYIVVPVVALMEGVIHAVNAETPEFVSAATLEKAAASWNGKPVTLGHPKKNGTQCSASSPEILESHGIGTIRKSHMVGKKMLQEAWIDKLRAKQLHPDMYGRLLDGKHEEVSVGAFVITDNAAGTFNGKPFLGSWVETAGDHLAFLPGGRGACSIEMGCGAHRAATMRVCGDKLEVLDAASDSEEAAELIGYQTLKTMSDACMAACEQIASTVDELIADEEDDPTETAAEEDAEEEIESARLDAIQALCTQMMGNCSALMNLAYKMNQEDAQEAYNVRAMAAKVDCPTCDGNGQITVGEKQKDCPTCDGTGKVMRAAAGKRNSNGDSAMIQFMHDATAALGAECKQQSYKMMEEKKPEEHACGCQGACACGGHDKPEEKVLSEKAVRSEGGKWAVYTLDGSVRLSTHGTREEALAQRKKIDERTIH